MYPNELNETGLQVWKHKTNKRLFLEKSYRWSKSIVLIDETDGRQVIDSFVFDSFNFSAWELVTIEESKKIKNRYRDIYRPTVKKQVEEMFEEVLKNNEALQFAQWIGEKGYSKHQTNDMWYDNFLDIEEVGNTKDLFNLFLQDQDWKDEKADN